MSDSWTVAAVVIRVVDAGELELRLDLGWRIHLDVTARLVGIWLPPVESDKGMDARRVVCGLLESTGGALDGSGAEVTFVCHELGPKGSVGQVLATTPQGRSFDLGEELMNAGHGVPADART